MILSRHILNKSLNYDGKPYDEISSMIDYWKTLLWEKYELRPGDSIATFTSRSDPLYLSFILASLELGLALSVVDHVPDEMEVTNDITKQALYGDLKLAMFDEDQLDSWDATIQHSKKYFKHIDTLNIFYSYNIKDETLWGQIKDKIFATQDTVAINTTSSGTTGTPKVIRHNHAWVYDSALRATRTLNLKATDNILHCRQLSHGCVFDLFLLPTLMICKNHYVLNYNTYTLNELVDVLITKKINKVMLFTEVNKIINLLPMINHPLDLLVLCRLQKEWVTLCKQKKINRILGVYGASEIGNLVLGPEINQASDSKSFDVYNYGPLIDDYFSIQIKPQSILVTNNKFKKTVELADKFELKDNHYYFYGRTTNYKINDIFFKPEDIDKIVSLHINTNFVTVVDEEYQCIYVAVFQEIDNTIVHQINQTLNTIYSSNIKIEFIKQVDFDEFHPGFKISMPLLRAHFRKFLS